MLVFIWRWSMEEPERYKKDSMKHAKIPYMLVLRRYGKSLAAISFTWFLYDFIVYPVRTIRFCGLSVSYLTLGTVRHLLLYHCQQVSNIRPDGIGCLRSSANIG